MESRDRPVDSSGFEDRGDGLLMISKRQLSDAVQAVLKSDWFETGFDQEPTEFQARYVAGGVWNQLSRNEK